MWSKLGTIKLTDFWRGLIVAVATVPVSIIYESLQVGSLTFDWKLILSSALIGGLGYLLKNLGTGQGGNILTNK